MGCLFPLSPRSPPHSCLACVVPQPGAVPVPTHPPSPRVGVLSHLLREPLLMIPPPTPLVQLSTSLRVGCGGPPWVAFPSCLSRQTVSSPAIGSTRHAGPACAVGDSCLKVTCPFSPSSWTPPELREMQALWLQVPQQHSSRLHCFLHPRPHRLSPVPSLGVAPGPLQLPVPHLALFFW